MAYCMCYSKICLVETKSDMKSLKSLPSTATVRALCIRQLYVFNIIIYKYIVGQNITLQDNHMIQTATDVLWNRVELPLS